jgi:hypothetical protein
MSPRCAHKRSFMTPCVIDDGAVAYGFRNDVDTRPICVGCGRAPEATGVAPAKDWDDQVRSYLAQQRKRQR